MAVTFWSVGQPLLHIYKVKPGYRLLGKPSNKEALQQNKETNIYIEGEKGHQSSAAAMGIEFIGRCQSSFGGGRRVVTQTTDYPNGKLAINIEP